MAKFEANQNDDDPLSFLLNPQQEQKPKRELPFPPGSFARECVDGWLDEAAKIDSGELRFAGKLGEVISKANRAAVLDAVGNPSRFLRIAAAAACFDFELAAPMLNGTLPLLKCSSVPCLTPEEAAELARRLDAFKTRGGLIK